LGAHVGVVALFLLVFFILQFLGWNIPLFTMKPPPDVEFVLVDNTPSAPPRNPTTRKAEHASRSGGKKVANRPIQMAERAAGAPAPRSTPRPAVKPTPQTRPQPMVQPAPRMAQARPVQRPQPHPQAAPTPTPRPTPAPAPRMPSPRKVASAAPSLPPSPIAPTIRTPAPPNPSAAAGSGPIVKTPGSGTSGGGPNGGASGNPGPSMIAGAPSRGSSGRPGSTARTGGGGGSGGHGSYNQDGTPGGGGGRDGIDAMAEPDFGPYIAELQRRIRRNWAPPTEDRSKRVIAMFKIGRAGNLMSVRIQQSSGSPAADQAAIAAVHASAPFRQLPPNFRGNDIDVQFIFDYEIYGQGGSIRRR
jgi:TonB family protein